MTTQQDSDMNRNPDGIGGFGDHPENRNPGGWNKNYTFSYQYNRFMHMTNDELQEYRMQPAGSHRVVEELAYKRIMAANNSLPDVKEITDRTEGKPKEADTTPDELNIKFEVVNTVPEPKK